MSLMPLFFGSPDIFGSPDERERSMFGTDLMPLARTTPLRSGNLRMELQERDQDFQLRVDVPGLSKEEVNLSLDDENNMLTVTSEHREEQRGDNDRVHWSERSYGHSSRSIRMPQGIEASKITAEQKNGVLNITLPKRPASIESSKTIQIN